MRRGLGRLPLLGRLSARAERSPSGDADAVRGPIDLDLAPLGPPVLLPTAIISQLLFDATEIVPRWAKPRAEPEQATPPTAPKAAKRPRKPKATETAAAEKATATPRSRSRKRDVE
jgi:hypothetical protein